MISVILSSPNCTILSPRKIFGWQVMMLKSKIDPTAFKQNLLIALSEV